MSSLLFFEVCGEHGTHGPQHFGTGSVSSISTTLWVQYIFTSMQLVNELIWNIEHTKPVPSTGDTCSEWFDRMRMSDRHSV